MAKSAIPNDTVQKNLGVALETGVQPCQLGDLHKVRKRLGLAHIATVGKLYWTLFETLPKVLTEESKGGLIEDILAWTGVSRDERWTELFGASAEPPAELRVVGDDDPELVVADLQAKPQRGALVELYALNTAHYNNVIARVMDDKGVDDRFQVTVTGFYLHPDGALSTTPCAEPAVRAGDAIRIKAANLRFPTTLITTLLYEDHNTITTATTAPHMVKREGVASGGAGEQEIIDLSADDVPKESALAASHREDRTDEVLVLTSHYLTKK